MPRIDRLFAKAGLKRDLGYVGLRGLAIAIWMLWVGATFAVGMPSVVIGTDRNAQDNPFVQPSDPAELGFGLSQSLLFGDVLTGDSTPGGDSQEDVLIGGLGADLLLGGFGDDVLIGGPEHFNEFSSDRSLGEQGRDIFIWSPGDGTDYVDGGIGTDAMVVGLLGEVVDGVPVFSIPRDEQAGNVFLNPDTNLPRVDVSNTPGFCRVVDASSQPDAGMELEALGLSHLVQFIVRAEVENGPEDGNNGLFRTLHLKDVEYLICASEAGGEIVVLDLTVSPPQPVDFEVIEPRAFRFRLLDIVF